MPSLLTPSLRLLLLVFVLAGRSAPADETPVGGAAALPAMTLTQAEDYARLHNPALQTARARVTESQALSRVPGSGWLPKVGASAQLFVGSVNNTTAVFGSSPDVLLPRIGGRAANLAADTWSNADAWHPYASTLLGVGVTQQIFDFGLLAARTAAADAELAAERHRATASGLDVVLAVDVAFFSVAAAHGVLDAATGAVRRAQAERDQAAASVKAGLLAPIFLDRAEADLATFEVGLVRAQGGLAVARTLLATAVGLEGGQLDASGEPRSPTPLLELAKALELAFANDPQLLALAEELRARQEDAEGIWAELRPNLLATATLSTRSGGAPASAGGAVPGGSGWIPETPNWDVGILVSIPLFDQTIAARARAASERQRVVQGQLDEAKAGVAAAVTQTHELADEALRALPALQRAFDAAKRNEAQAVARFGAGLGNAVELADAEALLTDAEVQMAVGGFEIGRTEAFFERAVGGVR